MSCNDCHRGPVSDYKYYSHPGHFPPQTRLRGVLHRIRTSCHFKLSLHGVMDLANSPHFYWSGSLNIRWKQNCTMSVQMKIILNDVDISAIKRNISWQCIILLALNCLYWSLPWQICVVHGQFAIFWPGLRCFSEYIRQTSPIKSFRIFSCRCWLPSISIVGMKVTGGLRLSVLSPAL